jgi:hypothetical protein
MLFFRALDLDHSVQAEFALGNFKRRRSRAMTKPIPDKAEVAVEYPDKLYIGTFERSSRFDAHLDETGISLTLSRPGDAEVRKCIRMHLNYGLFADILSDLAETAEKVPPNDIMHRQSLRAAAESLYHALGDDKLRLDKRSCQAETLELSSDGTGDLSPKEEVLLLHALE